MRTNLIALVFLFLSVTLLGQTDPKWESYLRAERALLPVEGEVLYDGSKLSSYRYGGASGAVKKIVDADSTLPFGKVFNLTVEQPGSNAWEPQFQTPRNAIPVNNGDVLFYIFYVRVIEAESDDGNGHGYFYVQRSGPPWTGLGSMNLEFKSYWRKIYVAAQAGEDFDIDGMEATLHLGYFPQVVEIGGIIALNLGADVDVKDLPQTSIEYEGMEADAAWRAEAAARIDNIRKGNLTVLVKNQDGEPVKRADVHIQMQNHAYGFGTFMSTLALDNSADAEKYRQQVLKLFNWATTPFYMGNGSWGWYANDYNKQRYMDLAGWLQDHNIPTKGHVLIWPSWQWMPPFFRDYENDPQGMRQAIDEHLEWLVPIGQDYGLEQWDVVNEPHINHDVMDICGDEIMVHWYNKVHELDPAPRLILNEYNIIMGGGQEAFQTDFEYYIKLLLDNGAPLGGIGMQCHFDANLTGIPRVLDILDRFGKLGLPIQITEFDIDILDERIQAQYTRDFYTAVFSHPATDKIVMWGFWEGDQWKPNGAMIRSDWTTKPNYDAYVDLVFNRWWTDVQGETWSEGRYATRAFYGDYLISAEYDGQRVEKSFSHLQDGDVVEIQLPTTATGVSKAGTMPDECRLLGAWPNPFNAQSRLAFEMPADGHVRLDIIDGRGRVVRTLLQATQGAGRHEFLWDGRDERGRELGSGVYFVRLQYAGSLRLHKLLLLK